MKFEVRHSLPRPPHVVWREVFSDAYEDAADADSPLVRSVVEVGEADGRRFRRSEVRGRDPLPSALARLLGDTHLCYELREVFDDEALSMSWTVIPVRYAEKVTAQGVYVLETTPEGCERLVNGEITVSVPIIGGKIEGVIGDQLRAGWESGADFTRRWLLERT